MIAATRPAGGTVLDLLRAVAGEPKLQRHRYIEVVDHHSWSEPDRSELQALYQRFGVGHLPQPYTVDQLLNLIEGTGRP